MFQKTLLTYKLELSWLKVENEENLHKEISKTLNDYQRIYDDIIKKLNETQNMDGSSRSKCDRLTQEINQLKIDMQGDEQRKDQIRRNVSKSEEAVNETNRQLKRIDAKVERVMKNIQQLEKDMSEPREE